ncbi:MAG: glycoside hydrolase [Ruminococcus sp.]|nr:glycoside hydrolase [Ruminococcus sp.]
MKKIGSMLTAAAMLAAAFNAMPFAVMADEGGYTMNVTVDLGGEIKSISPYIYGINEYGKQSEYGKVTTHSVRQGGNRMTAYNWENNASNAGSDWKYSSDDNLSSSDRPADVAQAFSKDGEKYGFDYKLTTLQLAGYVAADKDGPVTEAEAAPSSRWNEVQLVKGAEFADEPDLTDGKVYMDEYVNYLVKTLGDSTTSTGMQAYSLDNEPCLWHNTHSRIHPEPVGMDELSSKSIEMAAAIKKIDPNAEVFGPALYGYTAYDHLADDESSNEWETIKAQGNYHWYIDYYLDRMKKAEEETGTRLLDVLDIHYYSESCRVGDEDRLQSVRTLYEKGFVENSWIGQWCQENIPILPTVQASIDKYYPGTKLAISEYNFGGENTTATIAQAEALGCFADAEVYFASIWSGNSYQYAGINLYTNYDGKGGHFGDTLVPTKTDDVAQASSYAAINGSDKGTVTAMLTNKSFSDSENAVISLENSDAGYEAAAVYAVYGDSDEIRLIDIINDVSGNKVNVTLPALSAAMVVITDDASDFDGLQIYDPDAFREESFVYTEFKLNENGYVDVPVTDPEHLSKVIITADVTSKMGSSWGNAGCAVSINAIDNEGTKFWTSEGYSLNLGSGSTATVEFDGTFSNDGVPVEAVVADGKLEFQKWWDASEKQDSGDEIDVKYTKIEVVYKYDNSTPTTDPTTEPTSSPSGTLKGDANCDGIIDIADATKVLQSIGNHDKYPLSAEGEANADVVEPKGITALDALEIQKYDAKVIDKF